MDSYASTHVTTNKDNLQEARTCDSTAITTAITTANSQDMRAKSIGNVKINILTNTGVKKVKEELLHVPDNAVNLLSVSKMVEKGLSVHFTPNRNKIEDSDGHCLGIMTNEGGIFKLMTREERNYLAAKKTTAELWHKKLGHLNYKSIIKLSKEPSSGICLENIENVPCIPCVKGKHHRLPFPKEGSRAKKMLEIIHSDLCGPMETASLAGSK